MDPDLLRLIILELAVAALTGLATWRYATYYFERKRLKRRTRVTAEDRLSQLEDAVDGVAREVERLGESQDFVQELLAKRLAQLGLRNPRPASDRERTPV